MISKLISSFASNTVLSEKKKKKYFKTQYRIPLAGKFSNEKPMMRKIKKIPNSRVFFTWFLHKTRLFILIIENNSSRSMSSTKLNRRIFFVSVSHHEKVSSMEKVRQYCTENDVPPSGRCRWRKEKCVRDVSYFCVGKHIRISRV